jgi:hypothetical protein
MESVIQNVRISQDLRNKLEKLSQENEVSISVSIRDILNNYFEDSDDEDFDFDKDDYLFHSSEFLFLVAWVFEKATCAYDGLLEIELRSLKNTVINVIKEPNFPSDLKLEFEKVLVDLVRYITEYHSGTPFFTFCKSNHSGSFDYSILLNYLKIRAFENIIYL